MCGSISSKVVLMIVIQVSVPISGTNDDKAEEIYEEIEEFIKYIKETGTL